MYRELATHVFLELPSQIVMYPTMPCCFFSLFSLPTQNGCIYVSLIYNASYQRELQQQLDL